MLIVPRFAVQNRRQRSQANHGCPRVCFGVVRRARFDNLKNVALRDADDDFAIRLHRYGNYRAP